MANQAWIRLSMRSKTVLVLASAAAVSSTGTFRLLHAQSPTTARPSFEVASVKLNKTEGPAV
jgi:hypothetical protein